jgi:hypothetical protein
VKTARDLKLAWLNIAKKCQTEHSGLNKMAIFSHAIQSEKLDGVGSNSTRDAKGNVLEDGTMTPAEIHQLAILP